MPAPKTTKSASTAQRAVVFCCLLVTCFLPTPAAAQVQVAAQIQSGVQPVWNKGIQPISAESYYHAIECGKQSGKNPPCVFWDTGLCTNEDFALAMYTPYKMVAYEVWRVVSQGGSPPQPDYQEAQRTRVTVGITPTRGSKNAITSVVVKRGGKTVEPTSRAMDGAGGRFTFDPSAFAATDDVTLELAGKTRTIACAIAQPTLTLFR